jgi:ribonuclease P protein component
MMQGDKYLTKEKQFSLVYHKGRFIQGNLLSVKFMTNSLDISRCGIIVGKRVGKAVVRNRIKRLLREISRQIQLKPGWDIVFFTNPKSTAASYDELKELTLSLLSKAQLLMENYEKACPTTN